jgi:hypothetical protein
MADSTRAKNNQRHPLGPSEPITHPETRLEMVGVHHVNENLEMIPE